MTSLLSSPFFCSACHKPFPPEQLRGGHPGLEPREVLCGACAEKQRRRFDAMMDAVRASWICRECRRSGVAFTGLTNASGHLCTDCFNDPGWWRKAEDVRRAPTEAAWAPGYTPEPIGGRSRQIPEDTRYVYECDICRPYVEACTNHYDGFVSKQLNLRNLKWETVAPDLRFSSGEQARKHYATHQNVTGHVILPPRLMAAWARAMVVAHAVRNPSPHPRRKG